MTIASFTSDNIAIIGAYRHQRRQTQAKAPLQRDVADAIMSRGISILWTAFAAVKQYA